MFIYISIFGTCGVLQKEGGIHRVEKLYIATAGLGISDEMRTVNNNQEKLRVSVPVTEL